jgi:hypothetical protein
MSRLLRLYPRAWRDRYLDEVAELLAARPPTPRDQLDLLRGAVDAWLHPQVSARSASPDEVPVVRPIGPAILAVLGGVLWSAGGVLQHVGPFDPISGYKDSSGFMIITAAALVTAIAAIARTWSEASPSAGQRRSSIAILAFVFLLAAPWPILVVGYWGLVLATIVFGAILAVGGWRTGSPLAFGAIAALAFNTESAFALAVVPLGIAWIAMGIEGALRPRTRTRASVAGA